MERKQIIKVENEFITFKLDTGAEVNVLPKSLFKKLDKQFKLRPFLANIQSYSGHSMKHLGVVSLISIVKNIVTLIDFVIVDAEITPILGLKSCIDLGIIKRLDSIDLDPHLIDRDQFKQRQNKDVFSGLGKFPNKCNILLKSNSKPVAKPPRRIPLKLINPLKKELLKLENVGIISKVEKAIEWVNNLVIVEKTNGELRLCLDPKYLNECIIREQYLIPSIENILSHLNGKSIFTVLDLKEGFYQIELEDKASELFTFSTPFGCYKFNRLPFGVNTASEIFQKYNEGIFSDIPGVQMYIDDIIIAASNKKEHDQILSKVIERARKYNIKFNHNKIQYCANEVKYLGYIISNQGISIDKNRSDAINAIENPKNVKELQRILGMINFVRGFIPNLTDITHPLRQLLKKDSSFLWLPCHTLILNKIKNLIKNAQYLNTFDVNKSITLQTDVSKFGLGCCLMQEKKPIFDASRSLTDAEVNYSQTEKEFLAIIFACYYYGRSNICKYRPSSIDFNNE